jgi:excisionase family DNA binding protein
VADDYVTMTEAQEMLGVSRFKIWQLVKEGKLQAYQSELDRRQKLIRRQDVVAIRFARRPIDSSDAKKAAA